MANARRGSRNPSSQVIAFCLLVAGSAFSFGNALQQHWRASETDRLLLSRYASHERVWDGIPEAKPISAEEVAKLQWNEAPAPQRVVTHRLLQQGNPVKQEAIVITSPAPAVEQVAAQTGEAVEATELQSIWTSPDDLSLPVDDLAPLASAAH